MLCGDWLKKKCSGFRPNEKYKTFFLKKGKATLNRHIGLESTAVKNNHGVYNQSQPNNLQNAVT